MANLQSLLQWLLCLAAMVIVFTQTRARVRQHATAVLDLHPGPGTGPAMAPAKEHVHAEDVGGRGAAAADRVWVPRPRHDAKSTQSTGPGTRRAATTASPPVSSTVAAHAQARVAAELPGLDDQRLHWTNASHGGWDRELARRQCIHRHLGEAMRFHDQSVRITTTAVAKLVLACMRARKHA